MQWDGPSSPLPLILLLLSFHSLLFLLAFQATSRSPRAHQLLSILSSVPLGSIPSTWQIPSLREPIAMPVLCCLMTGRQRCKNAGLGKGSGEPPPPPWPGNSAFLQRLFQAPYTFLKLEFCQGLFTPGRRPSCLLSRENKDTRQ